MSHVTYMNVSCHSYGSCHTYECVPSHLVIAQDENFFLYHNTQKNNLEKKNWQFVNFCVGVHIDGIYVDDWLRVWRCYVRTTFLFDCATSIPVAWLGIFLFSPKSTHYEYVYMRCVAVYMRCVAVCFSVMQCVAVCCTVLHCAAVFGRHYVRTSFLFDCASLALPFMTLNYRFLLQNIVCVTGIFCKRDL